LPAAARLTRSGRRRRLKISATWPWAPAIATAWDRISALAPEPWPAPHHPGDQGRNLGPLDPRPPGPPAGLPSHPDPEIKIHYMTWRASRTSARPAWMIEA